MRQYLDLVQRVLNEGVQKEDRTGTGTLSVFGHQMRFNLEEGEFIHTLGDAHIYNNHLEQVKLQLTREPRPLPKMVLNPFRDNIFDFKYDDFTLIQYNPYPHIKGEVAI